MTNALAVILPMVAVSIHGEIGRSLGTYRVEDVVTATVSNRNTDGFVVDGGLQLLPKT